MNFCSLYFWLGSYASSCSTRYIASWFCGCRGNIHPYIFPADWSVASDAKNIRHSVHSGHQHAVFKRTQVHVDSAHQAFYYKCCTLNSARSRAELHGSVCLTLTQTDMPVQTSHGTYQISCYELLQYVLRIHKRISWGLHAFVINLSQLRRITSSPTCQPFMKNSTHSA
jgi:hypothetical protein